MFFLPSPDSVDFVGEGDGRFPLGGLSDIPDSLSDTRDKRVKLKQIKNLDASAW